MSKTFTFPLAAALRQRVRQEEEIQISLARLARGYADALTQLGLLEQMHARARRDVDAVTTIDPEARMNALYYVDRCALLVEQQRQIAAQWEAEVQRVRGLLVAASQRRRALERLHERRRQEFDAELRRQAELQLDELVTLRHGRTHEKEHGYAAQ